MDYSDRIGRRIKLHDIHVLMAVVQAGSMGKAAVLLNTTQSAVSRTIADLEKTVGVRLLDRGPSGVVPTHYGRVLFARSTVVFDELRHSIQEIESLADLGTGELFIGSSPAQQADGFVFAVVDRLTRQYPRISIRITAGGMEAVHDDLRRRRIDLGFARLIEPKPPEDLAQEVLFDDPLVVVAGARSPWALKRKVTLAELVDERWAWAAQGTLFDSLVSEAFRAKGLKPPLATILGDSSNMRIKLAATGRYLAVVPSSTLRFHDKVASVKTLPIELSTTPQRTGIVTLKNRTPSPLAQRFIDIAREVAGSMRCRSP